MKGFPRVVLVLSGLLVLGMLVITLGRSGSSTSPSATSYDPSGVRALVELLQREGFDVAITREPTPALRPQDTAIGFFLNPKFTTGGLESTPHFEAPDIVDPIREHVEGGGSAIVASLDDDFRSASKQALAAPVKVSSEISGVERSVSSSGGNELMEGFLNFDSSMTYDVWSNFATAYSLGQGRLIKLKDGLFMTNRFLDREENAVVALGLIQAVAKEGGKVVFLEAAHGEASEPGLLETIGPWAEAAWWQTLLLFFVVVYTLGKRFGVPEEERFVQMGQRELVDAMAMIYQRGRATHMALRALHDYADKRLRSFLKLPMDAPRSKRDELVPPALAAALRESEIGSEQRIPVPIAMGIARKLEKELSDFLGDDHRGVKKRKRH